MGSKALSGQQTEVAHNLVPISPAGALACLSLEVAVNLVSQRFLRIIFDSPTMVEKLVNVCSQGETFEVDRCMHVINYLYSSSALHLQASISMNFLNSPNVTNHQDSAQL